MQTITETIKQAKTILTKNPKTAGRSEFIKAYEVVFRTDLLERLNYLIKKYGCSSTLSWELNSYGWNNPCALKKLISED